MADEKTIINVDLSMFGQDADAKTAAANKVAKELGISDENSGIMELDPSYKNGTDIKELFPIDDIVFEVDNKSLTNRPDL